MRRRGGFRGDAPVAFFRGRPRVRDAAVRILCVPIPVAVLASSSTSMSPRLEKSLSVSDSEKSSVYVLRGCRSGRAAVDEVAADGSLCLLRCSRGAGDASLDSEKLSSSCSSSSSSGSDSWYETACFAARRRVGAMIAAALWDSIL